MKGSITIGFNQATMIEAVQMYCDAQFTGKHKVKQVVPRPSANAYNSGSGSEFDIEITDEMETPK